MINNKTVLVTGGTGSFGSKFIKMVLLNHSPKKVIVFSRGEMKQWTMAEKFSKYSSSNNVEYVIGDVRDKERLNRVASEVDIIVHAAATKMCQQLSIILLNVLKQTLMEQ